ncbi:phospholipid-binding lipoprotein MlaA [Luteibacter rhizovicinus]|uniref:Phospholipid-binding lipoprotein MlaA n=1 Tax=Luteibacter rhizovicinus TaxID=242606 RepID=A0A4R3YIE9_9GAMM|nr:VacJ family lipoprotein [Luteibacter rhizovicinus]TCV92137.1 phospholipid-binding lipoprotein MlaA [Luteibacter rhizovicinus]
MPATAISKAFRAALPLLAIALLAGCTIAKPRTDDPAQKFNRTMYNFNDSVDKAVIRPVAVGYRKITNPPVRRAFSDFYTNIRLPITVANDLLQFRPKQAVQSTGRFLVNLTIGVAGFMDPASQLGIPLEDNDFGVTLARWGVPEGDYLVLPLVGPTTVRDVWRLPVDSYFFDPLSIYARNHDYKFGQQYLPQVLYLVTLRARAIDAESFLASAYDPYVFMRDAYRQQRLYQIYDGNPPAEVIEQMQGLNEENFDPDKLLDEQHKWEQKNDKP